MLLMLLHVWVPVRTTEGTLLLRVLVDIKLENAKITLF
jgi:hypothetical protein